MVVVVGGAGRTARSAHAGQQVRDRDVQGASQAHDRPESRFAARALEQRDLGAVEVTRVGQGLLGDACAQACGAQVRGELVDRIHGADRVRVLTERLQTKRFASFAT